MADQVHIKEIKCARGLAVAISDSSKNGGRVINTAIGCFGLFGNFTNYAAKLRHIGFKNKEDQVWHLIANVPLLVCYNQARAHELHTRNPKYGRMTETIMPPDVLANLGPTMGCASKLAVLGSTENNTQEALLLKADESYTPGAIIKNWNKVTTPTLSTLGAQRFVPHIAVEESMKNLQEQGEKLDFGRVALVKRRWCWYRRVYLKAFESSTPGAIIQLWNNDLADPEPQYPAEIKKLLARPLVSRKLGW
ncbi:hypothetical protein CEK25_004517 [Fusarium fujikuroi]|nr:hypothetical protein CEK25_004517 [Fusarium fujikuroi]